MLRSRHSQAWRLACTLALCLALQPAMATARPIDERSAVTGERRVQVSVTQPTPAVATDGVMRVAVSVALGAPAQYVEVRVRLRQPSGRLVYQKTEVRADLQPGLNVIEFDHDLADLDLAQGRYPLDVRVLVTDSSATNVTSRLLVIDPDTQPLPVSLVVVAQDTPSVTSEGTLARDPAKDTRLRDDLSLVVRLAAEQHAPLALAIPPVLIEQLGRVAGGYETTAGVVVPATDDSALRSARALDDIRSALTTGTIDLIDVPYALPDLARLRRMDAEDDLARHWRRSDEVNASILGSARTPVAAFLGSSLTAEGVASVAKREVPCVLARPSAIASEDATTQPGCYALAGRSTRVLVVDEAAAAGARAGVEQFYDALFQQLDTGGPAVILLPVGTGDVEDALAVQRALEWVQQADWLRLRALGELAPDEESPAVALATPDGPTANPYWSTVAQGRVSGLAYLAAVGEEDPEALAVERAVLISESSLFRSDAEQHIGYDGRDYAESAEEFARAQLGLVRLDAKDVTLSGSKGSVPLTLINDTGKPLHLTVRARSAALLPDSPDQSVLAGPTQNFLTIPIDLGNSLSETLHVEVLAGTVPIADTNVVVRASYMDRLATILMVVGVLGALLLFIRKRVQSTDAGTIEGDNRRRGTGRRE
jgi:hypothetical protein